MSSLVHARGNWLVPLSIVACAQQLTSEGCPHMTEGGPCCALLIPSCGTECPPPLVLLHAAVCTPSMVTGGAKECSEVNATSVNEFGNMTTYTPTTLDLCTAEGVPEAAGGKAVPGVMPNDTAVPDNTCRPDIDRWGAGR